MKINKNIFICALLAVMILFCISSVSAENNLTADLGVSDTSDDVVDLTIDDMKGSEAQTTLSAGSSSVTNDTFFNYFDKTGVIKKDVSSELTFSGNFSGLGIDSVTVDTPVNITGNDALFKNIRFKISSDNVTIKGISIDFARDGTALYVRSNDVTVDDVTINVANDGVSDTYGVYAVESSNFNLINSIINFDATGTSVIQHAVEIRSSNNAKVKRNQINANLPALDVSWSNVGINKDLPLAIGIQDGKNIVISENNVTTDVKKAVGSFPTLDSLMVYGSNNLEIYNNTFTQTDFSGEGKAGYSNVVDLYNFNGVKVCKNTILVNTSTGSEGAGTAYTVQATGPYTGLVVDDNKLTSQSKGPALGVYSQNFLGGTDITVTNNVIDVTGFATNDPYALVSGMELQDDEAVVSGNTITVTSINDYADTNNLYGISYAQLIGGNHNYTISNNTVYSNGKYAVYILYAENSTVKDNTLIAHYLSGNKAVYIDDGENNVVENNTPLSKAEIIIDSPAVWTGNDGRITVVVRDANGTVSIRIGNKIYADLKLVDHNVTQKIKASELTLGPNEIEVTYFGDDVDYNKTTATGNLEVINGVITADTFKYYFNETKYLSDEVPEGATLDFQGSFISDNYTLYINKPVNIISSTKDALFDSNTSNKKWIMFNIVKGANHTNITGINFLNADLFIEAPYVTVDNISAIANMSGVGTGTGFVVFRNDAAYGTIKNSYLENGGTSASILVAGYGAPNVTIDNNVINVTGKSGNLIGANAYVGNGVTPGNMVITNNLIYNEQSSTSTSYAVTIMGSYNIVENNTITHKGSGILPANLQWASGAKDPIENNTYKNNVLTGCGITATKGSVVDNNTMTGALSLTGANIVVTGNTVGSMTIGTTTDGANITADNNTIKGAVTINKGATGTQFTNNLVKDAVTVNSNENTITYNQISTEKDYAIDLKTTSNNTVRYNTLSSADKMGEEAVSYAEGKGNIVKNNGMNAIIKINVTNSWSGDNNTINITVVNATGTVNVNINGNEYKNIPLVNHETTFEIPANNIEVGLNELTVTFNGDKLISADSKTVSFYGLDNVVFTEVFFDFFDENGILKDSVPYTDLIFKGAFAKSSTVKYIVIDKPLNISSDEASLSLIGIKIKSDNVTIDGLSLTTTVNSVASSLGDLINVKANNVTLSNLNINYRVTNGNYDAIAIDAVGADNLKIINNSIIYQSIVKTDDYSASAINLDGVTNAVIDNNTITATMSAVTVNDVNADPDYKMMGLNTVNPVRIRASENVTVTNNALETKLHSLNGEFPTVQTILIVGSNNVLFDSNTINMVDTKSKTGDVTFLYALCFGFNDNLTVSNNDFYLSTKSGNATNGAAYPIQGVKSNINVIGNNMTTISNGPNIGFYVSSMSGESSNSYIANNFINVTGNATSNAQWALVSGIEITNGVAVITNNTIYAYNVAGYVEDANVYGVSYAQFMYGDREILVEDNSIFTQGKYTVFFIDGTKADVIGNELYAEELYGDDSVAPGLVGIVENNTPPYPPEIIIDGETVWVGSNSTIAVTVTNATGNVTIKVGNKTYKELPLVKGSVIVSVDAADLVDGANPIFVTYNGEKFIKAGNATGNLQVINGVITNETFFYYFNKTDGNNLVDIVPEGAILDFQGDFIGQDYSVYINKPVNVISSTEDAVFDSGANPNRKWVTFNVVDGANHTNITGISIINGDLFIKGASYVTVDDIYMKASMAGVGRGTGFLAIHSEAYYTIIKNSYFENGGTGSSCVVLGKGGKYATFDNNLFEITGSSGNVLSSNVFVGSGELPQFVNYTNNVINSHVTGSAFMYGITVCGEGNIIENNSLINFKGNAIINQFGATSTKNIYRNNTITGGGSMAIGTYSLVENNNVAEGALTVTEGSTFINNTAKSLTISGKDVVAKDNIVLDTVTISGLNTTFTNNHVNGLITVSSDLNIISDNVVFADTEYAIDLKSTENNTVTGNILYSDKLVGNDAVSYVEDKGNVVEDNFPINPVLSVESADIKVGENATVDISFVEPVNGTVEVIVDGKKYTVNVTDGKAKLEISGLAANKYSVGVTYAGDLLYIPAENSTVFTVSKIEVDVIIAVDGDIQAGDSPKVGINIANATGKIKVIVDGVENEVELVNGNANFTIENITAGEHSITVIYPGDESYASGSNATKFNVDPEFYMDINTDASYGKNATVEVKLPADATGSVTVTVEGKKYDAIVENGAATIEIPGLASGVHNITVAYSGDDKYKAASKESTIEVKADIEIPTEIEFNETGVISINLPDDATGNLTVSVDGVETTVPVVNGTASVSIGNLNPGDHNIKVTYSGDEKYSSATAEKTMTVTPAIVIPDETTTVDDDTITINLPTDATGNLTVSVDGVETTVPVVNGSASVDLGKLPAGEHEIIVKYSGDGKYAPYSKSVKTTVEKAEADVKISVPSNAQEGKVVPVTITMPNDANGTIFVDIGGTGYYAELVNGSATINVRGLTGGVKEVTYRYAGDSKYLESAGNVSINILYKPKLTNNKALSMFYLDGSTYKVRVWGTNGKVVGAGKIVTFKFNGKTYRVKTNKYGYAILKITQLPKRYVVTASYGGAKVSNVIVVKRILVSKNVIVKKSAKRVILTASLKKVKGKYLSGKVIKFRFYGKTYSAKTNKKGIAKVIIKKNVINKLKAGKKYAFKVTYVKDSISKIAVVRR